MRCFGAIILFVLVFKITECNPIEKSGAEPVDLSHICMKVLNSDAPGGTSPIILLHGLGSTKEGWKGYYQLLALKTGRRVCIVDLRNHGSSPKSEEADVEAMSKDVVKLLDTIKVKKAILLGHSLGGKLAVHVALKYPDKVEKLIIEDMRPNGVTPKVVQDVKLMLSLVKMGIDAIPYNSTEREAKQIFAKFVFTVLKQRNITLTLDPQQIQMIPIDCVNGKCHWKVNMDIFDRVIKDPESFLTPSEGVYTGPALFVYGTISPFKVGEDEANIRRLFPNAKLVPIEGAGHVIHIAHRRFWEVTIKFINEN